MNQNKVIELKNQDGDHGAWMHYCPGCKSHHSFDTRWKFNGDLQKPTFTPSMLVNQHRQKDTEGTPAVRCHYFLTDGKIQYLPDCDHELKGQTIDCPVYDETKDF